MDDRLCAPARLTVCRRLRSRLVAEWHRPVVAEYRAAMVRREYSGETIKKRVLVVRRWLLHAGQDWPLATWHDIDAYGDLRRQRITASGWRDEVSNLSHFYKWAMRNELAERDPTALVERPRIGVRVPRPATDDQYRRLIDGAGPQMLAILELMAWCGLRCCEVADLQWANVDLDGATAIVHGKRDKERIARLPRRVVRALEELDHDGGYVFRNRTGAGPYRPSRVSQMVATWARAQGVPITAHQLRHRFATKLLAALEGDLLTVQQAMGHSSVATTQIYTLLEDRRALEAVRALDELADAHFAD